jgi:hypothetical protein
MKSHSFTDDDDDSSAAPKGVEVVVERGSVKQYSVVTFEHRVFPLGPCRNSVPMDLFFATGSSFPVLVVSIFNVFRNTSHCINDIGGNIAGHLCLVDYDSHSDIRSVCGIAGTMKAQALVVKKWDPTWFAPIPVFVVPAERFASMIRYCKVGKVLIQENLADLPFDTTVVSAASDVPFDEMKIAPNIVHPLLSGTAQNPVDVTGMRAAHSLEVGRISPICCSAKVDKSHRYGIVASIF